MMDWFVQMWNRLVQCLPAQMSKEDVPNYLPQMASLSLDIGLLVVIGLLALLVLLNKYRNGKWTVPGKLLATMFCVSWVLCFIVYEIGIDRIIFLTAYYCVYFRIDVTVFI